MLRSPRAAALVAVALLFSAADHAEAGLRPRLEVLGGPVRFTPLADFDRFLAPPQDPAPQTRTMDLEDGSAFGLRLSLDLHPELDFGWTRTWMSTRLVYSIDGDELRDG